MFKKTRSIGELLREERTHFGMTIDDFSRLTRIRKQYIVALEENRFSDLPAATFVKGYIRIYGQVCGFDHRPVIGLLRRDYKESAVGKLVPSEFLRPSVKSRAVWAPVTYAFFGLLTVFLSLVGYVGYQWYLLQKPPELLIFEPKESEFVSAEVLVTGRTISDGVVSVNSQPVAIDPDGSFSSRVRFSREGINTFTVDVSDHRGKKNVLQRSVHVRF